MKKAIGQCQSMDTTSTHFQNGRIERNIPWQSKVMVPLSQCDLAITEVGKCTCLTEPCLVSVPCTHLFMRSELSAFFTKFGQCCFAAGHQGELWGTTSQLPWLPPLEVLLGGHHKLTWQPTTKMCFLMPL